MNTISVCMIVKDEEKNLPVILENAKLFADEIIIVDTGSKDNTKKIAKKYTNKIYDFPWCDDFSKARNFSFSKANCDYMMWLDADDFILQYDIEKINKLKKKKLKADVYMFKYVASFDENFKPLFSYYRERLVKRDKNFQWHDPVHEVIIPRGKIEYLDVSIYHNKKERTSSDRNLKIYQKLLSENVVLTPRQRFYYARELMYNNHLDESIRQFSNFIIDKNGWIENKIEACLNLARCYVCKNEYEHALTSLFGSFVMGLPRGEILCEIGNVFLRMEKIDEAIYWYKQAKVVKPNLKSGAFVVKDCYDFLPSLQLCVCYYKKGDMKLSKFYHEQAKKIHPTDRSVIHNEEFFNLLNK